MKKLWKLHAIAIVGFVFAALALGCAAAPQGRAEAVAAADNFTWATPADNNGVRLVRYTGTAARVTIPAQHQRRPVTEIGSQAFMGGTHLTEITIPNRVIHIWNRAFADNRLTNVTLPDSLVTIGPRAFEMNTLTNITIPNSVIFIWNGAFANNPTLTSITIGNGVGVLYEGVFSGSMRNVTRISIGANVQLQNTVPSCLVWSSFRSAYEANGHRAGIYTLNIAADQWSWQAR